MSKQKAQRDLTEENEIQSYDVTLTSALKKKLRVEHVRLL